MSLRKSDRKKKNVRTSYALRFSDGLVTTTLTFAVPVMIYAVTHNVKLSGISFMLEWLPRLVAIPLAGQFVDHFGSRRIFLVTNSIRFLLAIVTAFCMFIFPHAWQVILLFGICAGMMAQASFVAAEHMGMALTEPRASHRIQAMQVSIDQAVLVLGPLLGGLCLALAREFLFVFVAILSFLSVILARQVTVTRIEEKGRIRVVQDLLVGFRTLKDDRTLLYLAVGFAGTNLLFALIVTMTPAFVSQHFHLGSDSVSFIWSIAALSSIVTVMIAKRLVERVGIIAIGIASTIIACGAASVLGFTHSFVGYVIITAVFVSMDSAGAVFLRTARNKLIPKEKYGVTVSAMILALLIPYPLAGWLVAVLPFDAIGWLLVGSAAMTLVLMGISFRVINRSLLELTPLPQLSTELNPE